MQLVMLSNRCSLFSPCCRIVLDNVRLETGFRLWKERALKLAEVEDM